MSYRPEGNGKRPGWSDDLDVLDKIERALTAEQHGALHHMLEIRKIEPDAWLAIPALAQVFGSMAAANITGLLKDQGVSDEQAFCEAGTRLGISAKTLRTWARRWEEYAAQPSAK